MYKIKISELPVLFDKLSEKYDVFLPVDHDNGAKYKKYEKGDKYSDKLNTVKSPKDFFFPQTEDMMRFKTEGKKLDIIDIREPKGDFIIFGVRGCDVKSFEVLDNVFLSEPVDTYYAEKRAHGVLISCACSRPSETCFCRTYGIDASEPSGDISTWKTSGTLYLRPNTDKGEAVISVISGILTEADDDEVNKEKERINKILDRLPLKNLTTEGFGAGRTEKLFDRPEWAGLSQSCLGCGTCTFVCPTCQCYDIRDFKTNGGVIRYRCWDSCMYSEFTKMSAGQPRLTQKERFRQRFMHKLVYYPENNGGLYSCVGCGRCLQRCPINMNIVKVMKALGGANE
jgi:heterodisulfide reductase subunit C